MELTFKTKNKKQIEASQYWLDNVTEEILYGGAKGGGKSFLGASLVFGDALIYPGTHYFIARQELNDLVKFTIPTIHEVFQKFGIKFDDYASYNGQDKVFNLKNGSKVFLLACKELPSDPLYERFGSMQMTRGWIEEGGEIVEAAKANLSLSIGRWKNQEYNLAPKLLITANPKKGWMKREFVDYARSGTLPPSKKYIQAFATDNSYLPQKYIDKLANEKDTVRRQRLWLGNWDYEDADVCLVTTDALEDMFTNTAELSKEKYLIVDVARKGVDRTVFAFWRGLTCYRIEIRTKQGTDQTEQQAKDYARDEQIPYSHILIDEDGIGGGVVDHLPGVKGFNAGSVAIPTDGQIRDRFSRISELPTYRQNYSNLKAQCGWKLAELINDHKIAVLVSEHRDGLLEEIATTLREKDPDKENGLRLIPKDEVKAMLGRSPDIGDTFLMRAWFEIQPSIYKSSSLRNNEQEIRLSRNREANMVFHAQ